MLRGLTPKPCAPTLAEWSRKVVGRGPGGPCAAPRPHPLSPVYPPLPSLATGAPTLWASSPPGRRFPGPPLPPPHPGLQTKALSQHPPETLCPTIHLRPPHFPHLSLPPPRLALTTYPASSPGSPVVSDAPNFPSHQDQGCLPLTTAPRPLHPGLSHTSLGGATSAQPLDPPSSPPCPGPVQGK